jgi:hypothetical protein
LILSTLLHPKLSVVHSRKFVGGRLWFKLFGFETSGPDGGNGSAASLPLTTYICRAGHSSIVKMRWVSFLSDVHSRKFVGRRLWFKLISSEISGPDRGDGSAASLSYIYTAGHSSIVKKMHRYRSKEPISELLLIYHLPPTSIHEPTLIQATV